MKLKNVSIDLDSEVMIVELLSLLLNVDSVSLQTKTEWILAQINQYRLI